MGEIPDTGELQAFGDPEPGYVYPDREPIYTEVCARIAKGETLVSICEDLHMPAESTVREWTRKDIGFSRAYARARDAGFDRLAEECLQIAEDGTNDYVDRMVGDRMVRVVDKEHVLRSKLRIETRLKLLAKWDPKRYGEKTTMDLNAVVQQKLPLPQLQQEIRRMLAKGVIDVESQEVKP
jgi:hypothetical protein